MLGTRRKDLDKLRQSIAALETRPLLAGVPMSAEPARHASALLPMPSGVVSEIFADQHRDAGAALGFAFGLARGLVTARRSAILVLQLADEAQEMGLVYGHGLAHFGIAPEAVVLARPKTIVELLWAMEEAIACRAVAAVIADLGRMHKALDFTASRRLSLRTAGAGASAFLIRYLRQREASAAKYRWHLAPAASGPVLFDPRAPGPPRWRATLEKGRLAPQRPLSADGEDYVLEWTANGFVLADGDGSRAGDGTRRPALPRPRHAPLGDGLSQTG